ncbi:MAG TPA: RecX family transcriptional regulator [Thermomicrobiaceae bacterium]|nr:RecX family transcriptional regulator [Thermomicrobiaceae bacterium]
MDDANIRSGRITEITGQAHDPERVNVFIDGAFAFGTGKLVAAAHGLSVGRELSEADVAQVLAAEEAERATQAALQFLAYRPRARQEVRRRLRRRGFSDAAADAAIAKLEGWRYLDDAEFARLWVENREEHQPRGRRLLESELRAKGVDAEVARQAVDATGGDELPAALDLARKRLASLRGLDEATQRRRLASFLQRRGYGWDVVRPVLAAALGGDDDELPLDEE